MKLPEPRLDSRRSIESTLQERRSIREYGDQSLSLAEVSQLLWSAQGINRPGGFRTAPSAGALYPLEVYILSGNVTGLAGAIYRYDSDKHELIRVTRGDKRGALCSAALGQECVRDGAAVMVLAAVYERTTWKYGRRGERYVHMEIGHAAQNVLLQAAALGLGTVVVGAFDDTKVKRVLNMKNDEHPLYIIPIGVKE